MIIARSGATAAEQIRRWKNQGLTIGFVPTMGYLHEGHLTLMRRALEEADRLVVTVFVNPTQFGPGEDYEAYLRDEAGDTQKCEETGVHLLLMPPVEEMYPAGAETFVECTRLSEHLCGLSRPGHFKGVTTIVCKLFCLLQPDVAVFGSKDYQQLLVIRKMVKDLLMPVTIIAGETVREPDGLAMSSRNHYLSPGQRASAPVIFQSMTWAREQVRLGHRDPAALIDEVSRRISEAGGRVAYVKIFAPETLDDLSRIDGSAHMAVAAHFGPARLIDNLRLVDRS